MSLFGLFDDGRQNPGINTKKPYNVDAAGSAAAGKTYSDAVRGGLLSPSQISASDPTIVSLARQHNVTPEFYIAHIKDYNK